MRRLLARLPFIHHQPPAFLPFRSVVIMAMKRPVDLKKMVEAINRKTNMKIREMIEHLDEAIDYLRTKQSRHRDASNLAVAAVGAICAQNPEIGIEYGNRIFEKYPDERGIRTMISYLWRLDRPEEALELLKMLGSSEWKRDKLERIVRWIATKNSTEKKDDEDSKMEEFRAKVKHLSNKEERNILSFGRRIGCEDFKSLTVACILDDFSYTSYKHEANFIQLSIDGYEDVLASCRPDILFVESAWRGKDNLWGSKVGHASSELIGVLDWCEKNKIPTVFWNKEDPIHFNSFLNVAKLFEYVFTTDIDCIHRYKMSLGHDRVYLLPFALQPIIHNPLEKYDRTEGTCFAGAYYRKYPERCRDISELISAVTQVHEMEIYDRNHGLDTPDYQFPEEFHQFIVGTLPFEKIDLAYKGYRFGLNLNTIKQSQSMFARRVFELIACNTTVISNFSRGMRLFFGNHVIATDDKSEVIKLLGRLQDDPEFQTKLRLSGLREVMESHTYQDRFAYIISKICDDVDSEMIPKSLMIGVAENASQIDSLVSSFQNQDVRMKRMVIIASSDVIGKAGRLPMGIRLLDRSVAESSKVTDLIDGETFVACLDSRDYHGVNYLKDLLLATRYSDALVVTKATFFKSVAGSSVTKIDDGHQYREVEDPALRRSLISLSLVEREPVMKLMSQVKDGTVECSKSLSIDEFNYCECLINPVSTDTDVVDDITSIRKGIDIHKLLGTAESITSEKVDNKGEYFSSANLFQELCDTGNGDVRIEFIDGKTQVHSTLDDEKHTYLYWPEPMNPEDLGFVNGIGRFYFDTSPGLRLMLAVIFIDSSGKKVDSSLALSNSNMTVELPSADCRIKLGIRIYSSGVSNLNSLDLHHHDLSPQKIIGFSEVLILTNHYPSYDDIYRNGFIHSRVRDYTAKGIKPEIFKLRPGEKIHFSEFEGVDVITGSEDALRRLMDENNYRCVLVHFLDALMWDVLKDYSDDIDILVWLHGSEVQPWHRRLFNYTTDEELNKAKIASDKRMDFWVPLLQNLPERMSLIFVSQYFAEEVMEDTGVTLEPEQFHIIHNPIDTEMFEFVEKEGAQRKRILSIRPFASRKYANDISVNAILELSKHTQFEDMEFLIIGDGQLFDETLEPLRRFENVRIQRGFLTHNEIASLHKEYGIILTPTRMDSQGVSRDEAMSSGLVPITNAITAIPEFVDDDCGILVAGEDFKAMAKGILRLYDDPELFIEMSKAAAHRVRVQSAASLVVQREVDLFIEDGESEEE